MSLLQMSFSGAVLILAITVVRAAAINRLSKKTFLFLWGIVLVRLLIPFSVPSVVSVYSLVDQNAYADTFEGTPMGNIIPIVPETQTEPMGSIGEVQQAHLQQQPVEHVPSASVSVSVWFVIWCMGMVLSMLFFTVIYLRWLSKFRTSRSVHNMYIEQWLKVHKLRRPISIRQSDRVDAPLTYGIFRPVILMPKGTDWADTKKLQYILLHEYVHICRYDTVIKLIATLTLCIHWFNPLVWVMYLLLNRDLELSCDESVVRRFGVASRSAYAHVLISMEAEKSGLMPFYNSFSKNAIEERITSIMKMKKASLFAIITAAVLVISFTAVFVTSAAKQPDPQPEPQSGSQKEPDPSLPYDPAPNSYINVEPDDAAQLSPQDLKLINRGIHDNQQNIYTGNIGNEEIRMLIARSGDSLYAEYTTRSGEGRVFQGNLAGNAAGFVLNAEDGEYLSGVITETDDGYVTINGEGLISQSSVTFTLNQYFITMSDDLENYYAFFEHNADEAEQFAQQIKDSINDKRAFAGLIQYPISIKMDGSQIMVENEESMIGIYDRLMEQNGFRQQVENIFTKYMFANFGGICIEDGIIWFGEDAAGDYKITAINPPIAPVSEIDTATLFAQMPDTFYFSSGAGGWVTYLYLSDDGTFTGLHVDGDMGVADPSLFPNGTEYRCEFAGAFTEPVKVSDYVCSTHVVSLEYAPPETVTYANGMRYITSTPYGLDNVDEVLIYLPGYPVEELSSDARSWIQNAREFWGPDPRILPFYVLYNVNEQEAFYSEAQ